jgi:hypothetical protein
MSGAGGRRGRLLALLRFGLGWLPAPEPVA